MSKITIDLENTFMGTQFATLREVIAGNNHKGVVPFNYISFRVIARMADLLQNKQQTNFFKDYSAGTDVI